MLCICIFWACQPDGRCQSIVFFKYCQEKSRCNLEMDSETSSLNDIIKKKENRVNS